MKIIKVFNLKPIIAIVLICILSTLASVVIVKAFSPKPSSGYLGYTIVLDAGHGGRDDGCSGRLTDVKESHLNLEIVKKLQKQLQAFGFNAVLTRKGKEGLYSENVDNYKKDDMQKRADAILASNADLVVSIHQNSFPSQHQKGAQAFYLQDNQESELFAKSIQKQFLKLLPNARKEANFGDYYMLKIVKVPTVIVECGYLTNPEEEQLLQNSIYQDRIAYAIVCGIIEYFDASTLVMTDGEYNV